MCVGFVCVLDMEWFELTLRLCNNDQLEPEETKLFSRLPDLSLNCSCSSLRLRTCVDSCIALCDLLVYLATHGDLKTPHGEGEGREYTSLSRELSSLNSQVSTIFT